MPDLTSVHGQTLASLPTKSSSDLLKRYRSRIESAKKWRDAEKYDDTWKRLRDVYRLKFFDGLSDQDRIAVAVSFATINVIAPSISTNHPSIAVNAASEDPDSQAKAAIAEGVINYWWRHYDFKDELQAAVRDFLIYGHGWVKVGWRYSEGEQDRDPEEMSQELDQLMQQADMAAMQSPEFAGDLPTNEDIAAGLETTEPVTLEDRPFVERVSVFDMYVDPEATSLRDARWVAQRVVRDLEEVKLDERYESAARRKLASDGAVKWQNEDSPNHVKDDGDRVTIWEFYDILRGEVSVFTNAGEKFLVKPQKMPYPFGLPFVQFRNYDVPDSFYPIGDLEAIEPLQDELNETRSAMVLARQQDIPKFFYRRAAFGPNGIEALRSKAAYTGVPVEDDTPFGELISPVPRNVMDPSIYQHSEQIESDIDRVSGVSEYQRGAMPEIRRTATEANIIQDNSNARAAEKLAIVEGGYSRVARMVIMLAQVYMTGEQAARHTSVQGDEVIWKFTADDIEGEFDFEVEAGSTQPRNEQGRRQQALQLMNALAPMFGTGMLNDGAVVVHVLREGFGVKSPERFLGPLAGQDPQQAQAPEPAPPEDPTLEIIKSLDYRAAPPDVQRQIEQAAGLTPSALGMQPQGVLEPEPVVAPPAPAEKSKPKAKP